MDGMLKQGQDYDIEKAKEVIRYYVSVGKKYKTGITILFHNSSFYGDWLGYKDVYNELIKLKDKWHSN